VLDSLHAAELAVLGAVVATGGNALDDIVIRGLDFQDPALGDVFDVMRQMHNSGKPVDVVSLSDAIPKQAVLVFSLTDHAPFAGAVGHYAEIVTKHSMVRRLGAVGDSLKAVDPDLTPEQMVDQARAKVDEATGAARIKVEFLSDILPETIRQIEQKATFTPSPWPSLNAAIGGFRDGGLYVIGARPGVGKTVVALQIAMALANVGPVAFSSLEMGKHELTRRAIASVAGVSVSALNDSALSDLDWHEFAKYRSFLDVPLAIDDRSGVGPAEIRQFVRTVSRKGQLAGVVVDYLQLMTMTGKDARHEKVAEFSRQLKIMAKDMHVPVIALSQLNRMSEGRTDKRPQLSELRESGAIEQDADCVILLHREKQRFWLDVAKNRHGKTAVVELWWDGAFSRALEYTKTR
jgi:replicative DNA helicase